MEENKVEDKTEKTFKERYLAGEIEFEEIDRYISRWNNSDDERTLAVYPTSPEELRRFHRSIRPLHLHLTPDKQPVYALQEMLDKQKA